MRMPRKICVLLLLIVSATGIAKEGVRAELARVQKQTGLTLAWYYVGVQTVKFADRFAAAGKELLPSGKPENGLLSPDGSQIAFPAPGPEYRDPTHLIIVGRDGAVAAEYPEFVDPRALCWSHDKSTLIVHARTAATRPPEYHLFILDLASHAAQQFGDAHSYATAQCWSPDDKQIVYTSNDELRVYNVAGAGSRALIKGNEPAWSPDGQWIAFHAKDGYYAVSPAGGEPKRLFKTKQGRSELFWSPDSRIVAYLGEGGTFRETLRYLDVGLVQLRIRRLSDGSEDWVWQTPDVPPASSLKFVWNSAANKPN